MATDGTMATAAEDTTSIEGSTTASPPATFIKLIVEYDGTRYSGFQRQVSNFQRPPKRPRYDEDGRKKGVPCTVQDCMEDACLLWKASSSTIESLRLRFAGRTDKGVHARGQVVVVQFDAQAVEGEDDWEIVKAINSRLPWDVSVRSAERCTPAFDPRKACIRKQYTYTIRFCRIQRDQNGEPLPISKAGPHGVRTAHDVPCLWLCPWALDDTLIPAICRDLSGRHDYSAFIHKDDRLSGRDWTISLPTFEFEILEEKTTPIPSMTARFRLEAKSFGRSMVRNLVGFVVDASRGKVLIDNVTNMWSADKNSLVCAAPASGLCLEHVWYE